MKDLQSLTGVKILSKKEQQSVKGGVAYPQGPCSEGGLCPSGRHCEGGTCVDDNPSTGGGTNNGPEKPKGPGDDDL